MKSVFDSNNVQNLITRIKNLTPETKPEWGKMDVSQMMAHCNVTYEMVYDNIHPKPKGLKKLLIKLFVKKAVVGPKPYPKNGPTAPQFRITTPRDFDKEQERLIAYVQKTMDLGKDHFEGKESHSFGPLTSKEWDTMFGKHLEHHLKQFNV